MKVSELYKSVAQLGFEDSLEEDDRFFYAANRALLQVCKIKPAVSRYVLNHRPLANLITSSSFAPIERTEDLTFEAESAKAYYFEADGNGVAYVEKYVAESGEWSVVGTVALSSSGAFVAYKGFIKDGAEFIDGRVRLRLSGEFIYSVRNVALYAFLRSSSVADIPAFEPFTRYDIKTLVSDFLALCCPPIQEDDEGEVLNQSYRTEGDSVLLLPYDKKGAYKVLYERMPTPLENDGAASDDETEIDLDEELCSLLPILVAAYVWVDDEPSKSEYYLALYRERAADIERRKVNNTPVRYRNTNGW